MSRILPTPALRKQSSPLGCLPPGFPLPSIVGYCRLQPFRAYSMFVSLQSCLESSFSAWSEPEYSHSTLRSPWHCYFQSSDLYLSKWQRFLSTGLYAYISAAQDLQLLALQPVLFICQVIVARGICFSQVGAGIGGSFCSPWSETSESKVALQLS